MKNKPLRHKEKNTFKFIPFSDRIANVRIDVVHQIKHKYELEVEDTTYFYQTYEKWISLNNSQSFIDLREEITRDIRTLPQLLARKEELIEILKRHISLKNPLNLQASLEFVVALAKDIRQEFYPHFFSFYSLLTSLLNVKDAEQLEWIFQCLAYLFKFLWRYLLNNLTEIFDSILPLLHESKPAYIRNFASQSFTFVARKIKDESKLFKLILRSVKDKPYVIEGCGRLLFEIVKGIKGHLHSCGENILNTFIYGLRETTSHSALCELLNHVISHLVSFISLSEVPTVWKILQESLEIYHKDCKTNLTDKNLKNVDQILIMIQKILEFKLCILLTNPNSLITLLLTLLEPHNQISNSVTDRISCILSHVLLSSKSIPQELSSRLVIEALMYLGEDDLFNFVLRIKTYSGFDGIVLPRLLSFCLDKSTPEKALPFLTKIVLHRAPPAKDIQQLIVWTPYSLNFSSIRKGDPSAFSTSYLKIISKNTIEELDEDFEDCLLVLYVLPHILPLPKEEAVVCVKNLIEFICTSDEIKNENSKYLKKILFLLSVALETLIYLKPDKCITKLIEPHLILHVLLKYSTPEYIFVLRGLDFYVSLDELNEIVPSCQDIKKHLEPLLLSPYEKVRLHVTHILYEVEKAIGKTVSAVLETCWLAECVPVTLQDYREKLKILQKLDCCNDKFRNYVENNTIQGQIPLSYLFGVLFLNFKLIWAPVTKIILSYGTALTPGEFWQVFAQQFNDVVNKIRQQKDIKHTYLEFNCQHLTNEFLRLNTFDEKPDYVNYRIMMWDILKELPDVFEYKSKDIVIHFLSFLEEEYNKKFSEAARSWNIKIQPDCDETFNCSEINQTYTIGDEEMDDGSLKQDNLKLKDDSVINDDRMDIDISISENQSALCVLNNQTDLSSKSVSTETNEVNEKNYKDIEIDEEEIIKKKLDEDKLPESDWKSKWITKSLLAYMSVFGKFRSPKSLYKEPELNIIFLDFLSSRVGDIQRSALDFLMSYKLKYLAPYKEHLYGLIDDKNFKNELSIFRIDTQSELVRPEHRPHLIPIVLRIVHSKMYSKVSSSRRETRQARKAAILRFLAGCSNDELSNFLTLAFNVIMDFVKDSSEDMVTEVMNSINLENCIPPRRLFTSAHLLNTIIAHCGGLMDDKQISIILRLILIVASYPPVIFNRRVEVNPAYIKVMKNVKMCCFDAVSRFFNLYEKYEWSEDETNAFFKVLIWPYLKLLTSEGVNSPTSLIKLFVIWSKNPRYFRLLGKEDDYGNSPLSSLMDLWIIPKLHFSVHNTIIDLIHYIISPQGDTEDNTNGIDLLSTFMPRILQILQNKLTSRKSLSRKELSVLSIVTTSAKEYISSESLLSIVLPSLLKPSKKSEEEISDLLNTVGNLIIKSNEPIKHLKQLMSLFSTLQSPTHRKFLLSTVVNTSKQVGIIMDEKLLQDLHSWDPKWVELPDYQRRLEAFGNIENIRDKVEVLSAAIIIRTSFHYLKDEKDLSLKDSARHCLKTFCPKICSFYQETKEDLSFILDETILPLVKCGLNDEFEAFRKECISFLGFLVREFPKGHPVLSDLSIFSNKTDLEVDFFENLVHLQLHRRVRALLRLSEVLETTEERLNPRTLVTFALPMISQFLLSPKYADKNTIVDSAIKAMGSICHSLSWRYYNAMLRSFLGKLQSGPDFQKQVIRIVSELLNSFHFDLTQADDLIYEESSVTKSLEENESKTNESSASLADVSAIIEDESEIIDKVESKNSKCKLLDKAAANKVMHELAQVVLPNLQKLLADKSYSDSFHKVNKKIAYAEKDEEDIQRIPLAIAIVKLLQKLPTPKLLERNLNRLFLKLANFLKSRSESVRKCTRTTLETIMSSLGPKYLPQLLSELCSLLTRGFHVHVLAFTVHGILSKLKPLFSKGDLDPCIQKVLPVCMSDLFGAVSEEKEVNHIVSKTIEAKANRSYDVFYILGRYSSEKCLLDIIWPLKEELANSVSHKIIKKATDCLQQIARGLTENEYLSSESLLELAYGLSTESIPSLSVREIKPVNPKQLEYESRRNPDTFIIPEEPKQKKSLMTMECAQTNAHVLVEFGLQLLYFLLKREKLNHPNFKPMLEPLVKLLLDCLNSKHVKVSTLALKCFSWVLKMDLVSINSNIKEISSLFLEILHKYAAAGLSKGDNFDLVMAAFKAVSVLVRSVKVWKPSTDDKRVLLLYCEQDIEDRERQATAFSLLKALIQKGVNSVELDSVMKKVATVSIASPIDSVRVQSRQVMLTYLMEYRLGKEVFAFLSFYLSQLSYETKIGRESAISMIRTLISAFPQEKLKEESGLIYVTVAVRLVNENDSECKKEIAAILVLLIQKLEQNARAKLFDFTTDWINSKKVLNRRLGYQLVGLFATAEKNDFESRIEFYLELVVKELRGGFVKHKPGRFVLIKADEKMEDENDLDHLAFHTLHSLIKVFNLFPIALKDNKYAQFIEIIIDECQTLLAHEHEWVRTQAVQVLGLILTNKQLSAPKSLALDLVSQLIPSVNEPLLTQCMKLLVHLAVSVSNEENNKDFSLPWLVRKVRQAVNKEIVYFPTSNQIRKMAFKWAAALSLRLSRIDLSKIAIDLLTPMIKELSSEDKDLAKVAKATVGYFKEKLGQSEYNNFVSRISQNIEAKKAIRKKERSQLAVTDPEKAAKRKINKQLKKKVLKKRKVELMKAHKFKRKAKKDTEQDI